MDAERASETSAAFEWMSSVDLESIPVAVAMRAKEQIADTLGVAGAAVGSGAHTVVGALGLSPRSVEVGDEGALASSAVASLAVAQGIMMHALDFDDTHPTSHTHVSAPVLAALWPLACLGRYSGREVLASYIAGAETAIRIGQAAGGEMHRRGFHPTAVFGAVGAAVAVGRLVGLGASRMRDAVGIVCSQAAGIMAYLDDGADTKILHPGWAAHSAIWAVRLAMAGLSGPRTALDGPRGLIATHIGGSAAPVFDFGTRWEIPNIAAKAIPVCLSAHGALHCVAELRDRGEVSVDEIEYVRCLVHDQGAVDMVLKPRERKLRPATLYEGRFSLPWLAAVLLLRGRLDIEMLSRETLLDDEEVLDLAAKVDGEVWEHGRVWDHTHAARVEIGLRDGRVVSFSCTEPPGMPGNPLSAEALREKFIRNLTVGGASSHAGRLWEVILDLERVECGPELFVEW